MVGFIWRRVRPAGRWRLWWGLRRSRAWAYPLPRQLRLRVEKRIGADAAKTVISRDGATDFHPLVVEALKGQVEGAVALIFHAGKLRLEGGRDSIGASHPVGGNKVEVAAAPVATDLLDVIELGVVGRRLQVRRRDGGLDQFVAAALDFVFERGRYSEIRFGFGRGIDPALLLFCHWLLHLIVKETHLLGPIGVFRIKLPCYESSIVQTSQSIHILDNRRHTVRGQFFPDLRGIEA